MKILLPGPCFEDSFADNVRSTLEEMGHQVVGLLTHRPSWYWYWSSVRQATRVVRERLVGFRPGSDEYALLRQARAENADLLLCLTWDLHPEILDELGKLCPGRRVLWWGDPPGYNRRWGLVNPGWDWIFAKDPQAVTKLRIAGRNAHMLHEAMNPKWHRPIARQANDRIAVAGNFYAYRQAVIIRLLQQNVPVALYGPKPPLWSNEEIKQQWTGRYVVREDKSRAFGEALGCLNTFCLAEGNSLNCRAFEIAGAGGLQLMEHRPIVTECFEPGREVLTFSTFEELLEHVEFARRAPKEMESIRDAGARRAHAEHTYRHRLEKILAAVLA
jgi:spore maturation protein CgeB